MSDRGKPLVVWMEFDCSDLGCPGLHRIPVTVDRSLMEIGEPIELSVPVIAHGILLVYWKVESKLEASKQILKQLFESLIKYTPFESLSEFAGVAGEELREEFGPETEIMALISARRMGILENRIASNIFVSLTATALSGSIFDLDPESTDAIAEAASELVGDNVFPFVMEPMREQVAISLINFLGMHGRIGDISYFVQHALPQAGLSRVALDRILKETGLQE